MAASKAIESLLNVFSSDYVALAGTDAFNKLNNSYLSSIQSDIVPAAIFLPGKTQDIASFLTTVKPFALAGDGVFAIRGAGQQPAPGCSNVQGGIVIDLRNLTGIEITDGTVSIAAGEHWGPVYEKLQDHGLAVTGGRSGMGGIGGLSLAGNHQSMPQVNF